MIHWVASADDPRLDGYRRVGDPSWLKDHHLFVAEGRLVVDRLLGLDTFSIQSILVDRAAHDAMLERLSSADTDVYVCSDDTLAGITGFNFHRGCLALAVRPAPTAPDALLSAERLLALEGVGNPDNIGGLFRVAAAFGVGGLLLSPTTGDPLYRKAIRTSMGAALRLPYARLDDWPAALGRFRAHGFRIVALTPDRAAAPLSTFARELDGWNRLIVLVGSEGPGLDEGTLAGADARVRIPIDPAVDSLNVVVAAGIALHRLCSS
jgi:tRNA G18 (ribose-2'-O)-methylase SpoU